MSGQQIMCRSTRCARKGAEMEIEMKRAFIYIGVMVLAAVTLSTAYYVSYKKTLEHYQKESPAETIPQKTVTNNTDEDTISVDTVKEPLITNRTTYKLITYDMQNNSYKEETQTLPSEWIGCNRQQLIDSLADYMNNLSLEEVRAGLISYDLQSFSKDSIVLIKNYDSSSMPYEYYVTAANYEVVVYYCDKKTIFEYTGIDARNLSTEEQNKLVKGIFVLDKEELYGILENYSS